MARYESEHDRFMAEWLEKHPQELAEQQKGRALWWDKAPVDAARQHELDSAAVPPKPYYYDAN